MKILRLTQDGKPIAIVVVGENIMVAPKSLNPRDGTTIVVNTTLAMEVDQTFEVIISMLEGSHLN